MANNIKGLTVEIGGDTTKLGKALENVNKKSRDLSSELGQINKLLKLDPGNADLLAQKQKVLASAIANTADKLETLKKAEKQVQAQFKRGEVSEDQVRALQREIIQTEQKMESYKRAVKETGKELDKTGDKASSFGDKAKKAGEIAAKGFVAVATATAAAAAALAKASTDAAAYADNILTTSTVTGISAEKLQAYSYAAELVDVSVETLTKSHAKNIKSMKAVQDGTKLAVDAYKTLGVEVQNADGSLRDGETVYWEVIDALGKMENETERDALAMQILGKSAQELNPLIEAGSAKMNELAQEAQDVGAIMSADTLSSMGAFDDAIQRLNGSAGAAKNALGSVLLPELTSLATEGAGLLAEFTKNLNETGGGLEGFIATVELMSDDIGDKVGDVLGGIITKASDLAPALVKVAISLIGSLTESLIGQAPALVETGIQVVAALLDGLTSAIPRIAQATATMIPDLVNTLEKGFPQLLDAAVDLLMAVVDAVDVLLPPLIDAIPRITVAIVGALTKPETISKLIDGALKLFMAIIDAVPLLIEKLTPMIPSIVISVANALIKTTPQLLSAAVKVFGALTQAVPKACAALLKALPQIWKTISNYLKQLPSKVVSIGGDLISGLWKGISNKNTWLKNKIKSWVGNVTSWLKKLFGINSPSKVTAYMGEMLDEGFAKGIKDNTKAPVTAMSEMSQTMLDAAGGVDGLSIERKIQHSYTAGAIETATTNSSLLGKLDKILAAIERGQIITINGDKLVGATVNSMNSALGQRRILAERGAV